MSLRSDLLRPHDPLLLQLALDVPEGQRRPDAGPDERHRPADDVRGVLADGEDEDRADHRGALGAHRPEDAQAPQHGAEDVARLVAAVKGLAEGRAARAVDGADVLDQAVDARPQLRALWDRRDSTRGGDLEVSGDVND